MDTQVDKIEKLIALVQDIEGLVVAAGLMPVDKKAELSTQVAYGKGLLALAMHNGLTPQQVFEALQTVTDERRHNVACLALAAAYEVLKLPPDKR